MLTYPNITYKITDLNGDDVGKYLPIETGLFKIDIYINISTTKQEPIYAFDDQLSIKIFDNNINLVKKEDGYYLYTIREGTCQIGIYYKEYFLKSEIVAYGNWFKQNYHTYFLTNYEKDILNNNVKARVMFDTYAEFIDILFAYIHDIDNINDPLMIKKKFLLSMANSKGFDEVRYIKDGFKLEFKMDMLYRELLSNLISIAQTRGSRLSYELFFGSLGFDINLLEFWYDNEGNLVEINSTDESKSTFNKYATDGTPIYSLVNNDPRGKNNNQAYNINNKSNFVMPIISLKEGQDARLLADQQNILLKFLDLLRPKHIKYLIQIFKINIMNLFNDNQNEEILDHIWGTIYQFKPIIDTPGNGLNGTSWIDGAFETLGKIYEFSFVDGGKQIIKNLGVPEILNFERVLSTNTYQNGVTIAAVGYDPYESSAIKYDEEIMTTIQSELYNTNFISNVLYEEEDFSDNQGPINLNDAQDKKIIYYYRDIVSGDKFGAIGSNYFVKNNDSYSYSDNTVDVIIIKDDLSQEEANEDDIVSILNETNTELYNNNDFDIIQNTSTNTTNATDDSLIQNNTNTNTNNISYINGYIYPYVYAYAPPCDIANNDGRLYYGTWDWDKYPRGTFIDNLIRITDEINISLPFEIYDIIHEPVRYDTKDLNGRPIYYYDTDQLNYDSGILLLHEFKFINTTTLLSDYYVLKNIVDSEKGELDERYIIDKLIEKYSISETDYYNIKPQ